MRNRGFTLIELLAVIIILGIIALITTPLVLNTVNDVKSSSYERSIEQYGKAVDQAILLKDLNSTIIAGIYTTTNGKILTNSSTGTTIEVEYDGNNVICNYIRVSEEGKAFLNNCSVEGENVDYSYGQYEICKAVTSSSLGNVPTGNYKLGDEYTCKVNNSESYNFYILSTSGNRVSLIMNQNIVNSASWNTNTDWYYSSAEYQLPPYEALSNLNDLTTSWNNISNLNELYTDEGANRYGTISLSGKARLPKFSELSGVGCTVESNSCPRWLTSNMSTDGYWTMSSGVAGYDTGYFNGYTMAPVLTMNKGRNLINRSQLSTTQTSGSTIAIRPVITVAKSNLSK